MQLGELRLDLSNLYIREEDKTQCVSVLSLALVVLFDPPIQNLTRLLLCMYFM